MCKKGNEVDKDLHSLQLKNFMGLLVPHQRQIHAFILYLVVNRADADDILQETLVEMWNKFNEYKDGTNFVAWGLTIAKFKVLQFIQKSKNYRFHFDPQLLELLEHEAIRKNGVHTHNERVEILKECVSKLQTKEKVMLDLRYEKNLTFEGISRQFGVSVPAIYKALGRTHARLAQCIKLTLEQRGVA
ncbi:MAG: sigma-70 family RNA polymerase sigma factor [Sedimentisphaerales bacterium]|nr:sigma-70 family RNA polymerase sigma factor [Sedimentisphaerales bacterium]